jgi:hypothetical protein
MTRRVPTSKESPEKTTEAPRRARRASPRTGFFDRRVRLQGDSSFSVPLALILLFPCLVIVLILTLFARSPDSDRLSNMPAGTPPSIRYVTYTGPNCSLYTLTIVQKDQRKVRQAIRCRVPRTTSQWSTSKCRHRSPREKQRAGGRYTVRQVNRKAFQPMVSLSVCLSKRRDLQPDFQRYHYELHKRPCGVGSDTCGAMGLPRLGRSCSRKGRHCEARRPGHHVRWYGELSSYVPLLLWVGPYLHRP